MITNSVGEPVVALAPTGLAGRPAGCPATITRPPGTRNGADRMVVRAAVMKRRRRRQENSMAVVVEAVIFVAFVFLMGIAFGVLITLGINARRKGNGPDPRGGGQGSEPG